MNLDLNDVLVFARVVEAGGFSAAAKRLGLPKSTVSRRVARLEKDLGARLLQRTTRKLSLTDAGSVYYGHCNRVLNELDAAQRTVSNLQDSPRGVLRVTAPNDVGFVFLGDLVAEYQAKYPEVQVVAELSTRHVDLVAEGFDVALRGGNLRDSSLVARKLNRSRSRLFASSKYLKRYGTPKKPEDLAEHRCLLVGHNVLNSTWSLRGPKGDVQVDVSGSISSNDYGFLKRAALAGSGIANLPRTVCPAKESLQRVLPEFSGAETGLYAVYPTAHQLSPKVRSFIDMAAKFVDRLVADGD